MTVATGVRPRRTVNERFFDSWTPESAWVLGLIFSDGCVQENRQTGQRTVVISGELETVEKVKLAMATDYQPCPTSTSPDYWTLNLTNRVLATSINDRFGLIGASSHTIQFPEVPEDMLPHFVRGLWDGDGTWGWNTKSWDGRTYSYLRARYSCVATGFVKALAAVLQGVIGIEGSLTQQTKNNPLMGGRLSSIWCLAYGSAASGALARWMYNGVGSEIRCDDKFRIASSYLEGGNNG